MRLTDYVIAPAQLKEQYFSTVSMQVGLRYFGGKNFIGKYLLNRIMEMQAYRYKKGIKAKTFVDCFTGGGKIGLTIPTGWFDTIVMNDINYGVYSYYKCCQERPLALIKLIESLGNIMCYNIYMLCVKERSTKGKHLPDEIIQKIYPEVGQDTLDTEGDMLLSAAMTYWVTQGSWLGETDPERITYTLNVAGKNENEEIRKRIRIARKRIMQINQKMTRQHYVIENLDYVELIEKYRNLNSTSGEFNESVIWYLDPPYHAATLNKSNGVSEEKEETTVKEKEEKPAPYEDSFLPEQTQAMTYLLATMKWFIKSDYDPYYFFEPGNKYKPTDDFYHDFDIIENLDAGFYREYLGSFHKSTNTGHDEGMEVIWSRYDGSPESLEYMGKSKDEENFWEHKLYTRKKWLYAKDRIDKFDLKANILFESEKEKQQEYEKLIEKVYEDFDKKYGETN